MSRAPAGSAAHLVAAALAEADELSVAELAARTGLGRSTVSKTLAAGTAVRTPGTRDAGRRLAQRWSPAPAALPVESPVASPVESSVQPAAAAPATHAARRGRGQLRERVLAQLSAQEQPVGVSGLARSLGASAGAVGNALERLVGLGTAVRVSEHPRRYASARR